ncbi:hypothetical protein H257_03246 [Aphanomyces astaci]|uniref:Ankyrin repeat domain-containing protein n=1 Tax=Aphanomyces astaci TaxID=112090 RepID=W4H302_APHAT|nr:hypothetical protein H257_03246 [Aphanomyces astaci]ETV85533.1 hypothetical protein H257_03246 [Aphanomyces astaci]|eukprot:XP_009825551.1 hypothetical protein H257_03246 [Aphanomyces astaci]
MKVVMNDRWAMEALHALQHRNPARLKAVFRENPDARINTVVLKRPGGAPFDFAGEGFFDGRAAAWAPTSFDVVKHGDTLVILALRQNDPACASVLVEAGANLQLTNVDYESGISLAWGAYLSLTAAKTKASSALTPHKAAYDALFTHIYPQLQEYHNQIKANVRAELVTLYTTHAPDRLDKIDSQITAFYGNEADLVAKVRAKYSSD